MSLDKSIFTVQCNKCLQIIGDSMNWITNSENKIILGIANNIFRTSTEQQVDENHSVYSAFSCSGCSQPLGVIYVQSRLEYNQFADVFTLFGSAIKLYFLGGAKSEEAATEDPLSTLKNKQAKLQNDLLQLQEVAALFNQRILRLEGRT